MTKYDSGPHRPNGEYYNNFYGLRFRWFSASGEVAKHEMWKLPRGEMLNLLRCKLKLPNLIDATAFCNHPVKGYCSKDFYGKAYEVWRAENS